MTAADSTAGQRQLPADLAARFVRDGYVVVDDLVTADERQRIVDDAAGFTDGTYPVSNPPDDGDIFLDFEGHPFWRADRGLFFLFGYVALGADGQWHYHQAWAHDEAEEHDRVGELATGGGSAEGIESQIGFAGLRIGAVAVKAVFGENGADVPVEVRCFGPDLGAAK